jgi:large subunit ribosomal protein L15
MKLNELAPNEGANRSRKRKGRGPGSGNGTYAGRGRKGQGARSGGVKGPYFEGGQLPLVRRLPHKRGFVNIFRQEYAEINLDTLGEVFEAGAEVTPEALVAIGLIKTLKDPIKVLGRGDLDKALTVRAHRFSASAKAKIEAAGGATEQLSSEAWNLPKPGRTGEGRLGKPSPKRAAGTESGE